MKPTDFYQYIEGYNKRLIDHHDIARRQAYFMLAPHLSKPMNMGTFFKEYWTLPGDNIEEDTRRKRLEKRLKDLKDKNGSGTITDTSTG